MAARKKGASKRDKSMELFAQGRAERVAARRAANPERTAKAMERLAKLKQKRERAERIRARRAASPERTARAIERLEQMRMTREIEEGVAKASLAGYLRAGKIVARREANPERTAKAKERLARLRARASSAKGGVSLARIMQNLPAPMQNLPAPSMGPQTRLGQTVAKAEDQIASLLKRAAEAASRGDRIGSTLYTRRARAMQAELRPMKRSLKASGPKFSARGATGQAKTLLAEAKSLRERARAASAAGDKIGANLLRARATELEARARGLGKGVKKQAKRKAAAKKAAPKKAAKKAAPKKTTKKKSKSKSPTKRKKSGKRKTKRVTKVVTKVVYKCPPKKAAKKRARKAPKKTKKRAKRAEPKEEGRFVPPHAPAVAAGGGVLECTKCKRIHSLREHWSHRLIHGTAKKQHNYKCTRGGYCVFERIQKKKPATRKKARVAAIKVEKMVGSRNISSIIKQAQQRVANAKFEQKYAG